MALRDGGDVSVAHVAVPVLVLDEQGRLLDANAAWCSLAGPLPSAGDWWDVVAAPDRAPVREKLSADADGLAECRLVTPGGQRWTRWAWRTGPEAMTRVVVVVDVTEDRVREEALARRASRDPLTRVMNREVFLQRVAEALAASDGCHVGLVYADLDGFKAVNDTGGHAVGDEVLRAVSARLRGHLRPGDVLGRVGGDEFAVLCLGPAAEVASVADRVRHAMREPVVVAGRPTRVGITVGVALAEGPGDTPEELLGRADRAMYVAKRTRRRAPPEGSCGQVSPSAAGIDPDFGNLLTRRLLAAGLALASSRATARADLEEQRALAAATDLVQQAISLIGAECYRARLAEPDQAAESWDSG